MSKTLMAAPTLAHAVAGQGPTCPVCTRRDNTVWGVKTGQVMFECRECGLTFFDRSAFQVHDYGNYYDYAENWDSNQAFADLKVRKRALLQQLAKLGSYVSGRRLLDIGAGPGYLCHLAANAGWKAQGVEVSENALRIGRQFLNVEYVQLDDIPDESLDVITCYHILEHIEFPDGFIRKLYSKLQPDGVVAVHVPHREPLSFLVRNLVNSSDGAEKHCQLYVPEHVSGFTRESLVKVFQRFGFRPLLIKTSAMWGVYADPFFLKTYLKASDYRGIVRHTLRCLVDNLGIPFGRGDWVVGHFRKESNESPR